MNALLRSSPFNEMSPAAPRERRDRVDRGHARQLPDKDRSWSAGSALSYQARGGLDMTRRMAAALLALALLAITPPVIAHHSFAAEYDRNKPITLVGTVKKVEWMNPHVYFYLDVTAASGTPGTWAIEGGAPNTLYRAGWRRDSLKIGDVVTVHGHLARDGSNLANMRTAILADGREVFGGQQDGGPRAPKKPGR